MVIEEPNVEELLEKDWLFIGGMPRSGTTLAGKIYRLHPEAYITYECNPGCLLDAMEPNCETRNEYYTMQFQGNRSDGIRSSHYGWTLPRLAIDEQMPEKHNSTVEIVRRMYAGVRSMYPGVQVFGDKSPTLVNRIEQTRRLFPNARILFMDREVHAALDSVLRQEHWHDAEDYGPVPNQETDPNWYDYWRERVAADWLPRLKERRAKQLVIEGAEWVRLEDLQEHPAPVIANMLEYAGLDTDDYPWDEALKLFDPDTDDAVNVWHREGNDDE